MTGLPRFKPGALEALEIRYNGPIPKAELAAIEIKYMHCSRCDKYIERGTVPQDCTSSRCPMAEPIC